MRPRFATLWFVSRWRQATAVMLSGRWSCQWDVSSKRNYDPSVDDESFARGLHYQVVAVEPVSTLNGRQLAALQVHLDKIENYVVYEVRVPESYREVVEADDFRLVAPVGFNVGDRVVVGGTTGNTAFVTLGADETETSLDWTTELRPWSDE